VNILKRKLALVTAILTVLLLTSCVSSDPELCTKGYLHHPQTYYVYDSLSITAIISDSVFLLDECNAYLASLRTHAADVPSGSPFHVPLLRLVVHNKSSQDLLVPYRGLSVRSYDRDVTCNVCVYMNVVPGSGGKLTRLPQDWIDGMQWPLEPLGYVEIRGGGSLQYKFPVINPLYELDVERIWPGSYWVVLCFQSSKLYDTVRSTWEGTVCSDTVTFRVIE